MIDPPTKDFRINNPALHRRYVIQAQEELRVIDTALEKFKSINSNNMLLIAGIIQERRAILLRSDAAFQEALWRIQADNLLSAVD